MKNYFCVLICFFVTVVKSQGAFRYLQPSDTVSNNQIQLYIFISPECPLCISYVPTINSIQNDYRTKGINAIAVVSGNSFSDTQILNYMVKYKSELNVIKDTSYWLARKYKASITPEAVIVKTYEKLYKGRIDNWAYALGKKRKYVTEHDLKNAINEILSGKEVKIKFTKAIGCYIE